MEILNFLEISDNLSQILIGLTMALLTVLVPLAVAIVMDIYQRRREPEEDFAKLDLRVVLENIFQIRLLLLWIILVFISLFAWEIFLCNTSRFIVITFSIIGIGGIGYIIYKIYRWIKGDVFQFRFEHLKNLKDSKASKKYDALIIAWHSVWETKNIDSENEKQFFEIFKNTINWLFIEGLREEFTEKYENNMLCAHPLFKLFKDYEDLIDNRNLWSLAEDQFPTLLDWHFERREIKKKIEKKEKETSRPNPGFSAHLNALLLGFLDRTLEKALKRTLLEEELGRETKISRFNRCVHDFDEEYGKFKKNKNYIKYFAKEIFCSVIESEEIKNNKENKEIMNFLNSHRTIIRLKNYCA